MLENLNKLPIEAVENNSEQDQRVLEMIKNETKERLQNLSDYHGLEHTEFVVEYSKILALGQGQNSFNAEMSGWTHDWGRALEESSDEPHAYLSGQDSKSYYRGLFDKGLITKEQYGDIQRAIRRHSSRNDTDRETLKIVRDADRLSRFSSLGLYHNVSGLAEGGKPFYVPGQPIIRPDDAKIMEFSDIKCIVDDLNFVLDWRKMMETDSGKQLTEVLEPVYRSFLKLINNHSDITDSQIWISFLKDFADEFNRKKEEFGRQFEWTGTDDDFKKWLKFYQEVESSEIFSEDSFQKFLISYNN